MSFKHHSIANFIIYRLIPKLNKSRDNLTTQSQKSQLHSHYWTGTFKLPDTFFYPYIFNFFFKSDSQKSIFASGVIQTPFDRKFNWLSFDDWLKRIARKIDEWYSQNLSTFNFVDSPLHNDTLNESIPFRKYCKQIESIPVLFLDQLTHITWISSSILILHHVSAVLDSL